MKLLQGNPSQKLQFQMAVTLEICKFNPPLVKPKCVSGVADFFENSKQTAENCKQTAETEKNRPLLKPILVFTTHSLRFSHLKLQLLIWVTPL